LISTSSRIHAHSIAQLILSFFGLSTSALGVILLVLLRFSNQVPEQITALQSNQVSYLIWVSIIVMLVTLPSIVLSIKRLAGKVESGKSHPRFLLFASAAILLLIPLGFLGSSWASKNGSPLLMALISILIVSIPIWWVVEFGRDRLPPGSAQRQWGFLNFGIFVTLPMAILVELIVLLFALGVGVFWLVQQPEFAPFLSLFQRIDIVSEQEIQQLYTGLEPLFQTPTVIGAGIFGISLLVPLIEELLKPLALWFFMNRNWSPFEGFSAGMLCGAAFAFIESITALGAIPGDAWLITVIGRAGAGMLHVFTTGMIGWALVSAWRDGKYLRLGIVYGCCVALHGVWNFFVLLVGLSPAMNLTNLPAIKGLSEASPWFLGTFAICMLVILFVMNRKLRAEQILPLPPPLPYETIE
jgi:hypothetical protein